MQHHLVWGLPRALVPLRAGGLELQQAACLWKQAGRAQQCWVLPHKAGLHVS